MRNRYTYNLLMQSEEKGKNILETVIYGLIALSAIITIWQFAEQSDALSVQNIARPAERTASTHFPS